MVHKQYRYLSLKLIIQYIYDMIKMCLLLFSDYYLNFEGNQETYFALLYANNTGLLSNFSICLIKMSPEKGGNMEFRWLPTKGPTICENLSVKSLNVWLLKITYCTCELCLGDNNNLSWQAHQRTALRYFVIFLFSA